MLLTSTLLAATVPVFAQQLEPAEVIGVIDAPDNKIPSIKTADWTTINITIQDVFGIRWGSLSQNLPIRAKYIWPIIHPSWRPFLGFTSLELTPEIVEGDPRGWYAEVTPTAIPQADNGKEYIVTLRVKTDDIAVDYAVVIGIKVTRLNVYGSPFGESYIYIPVKASSLNNIKIMSQGVTSKDIAPHSYGYFDVAIQNLGYYRDMFKLNFVTDNDIIVEASQQLFVLTPGDSQTVRINVLTPEKFYDIGTPNTIRIYATSSTDQNPVLIGTLVVVTKGVYITQFATIILVPIIIIAFLIFIFFFYIRKRRNSERYGKPDKPWNIPEERAYLEELKKTDKAEYEHVLKMMDEEYQSAMLWYKDYCQAMKHGRTSTPEEKKRVYLKLFKKLKRREKTVEEKKSEEKSVWQPKEIQKPAEPVCEIPEMIPVEEKPVDQQPLVEADENKLKALLKIRRAQDKQRKRFLKK